MTNLHKSQCWYNFDFSV